ncbi:MAG: hypothetical protein IIT42_00070 [Clostridia bacterium]|nr:hypothetical protein [Clostridia bacterium]
MFITLTDKLIKRYGCDCEVLPVGSDISISVKAFINPLLFRNKLYIGGSYVPDGYCDEGHYVYIGESRLDLSDMPIGTTVRCGDTVYSIKHSEMYVVENQPIYNWAVLQVRERGVNAA